MRTFLTIALSAAGAAALAAQGAAVNWNHWRYAAPVEVAEAPATRLVAVELTDAVSRRANPAWSDLRVVDDAGREVPYVLHARTGGTTIEWRPARLLEPGFVSGRYTEATVDLGPAAGIHNLLRLQVDGQDDLQARVEVATSADGTEWKVIREGAPISRLAGVGPERLDVTYPDSRSSLVRLRILDPARRVRLAGVRVAREIVTAPERRRATVALVAAAPAGTDSVWMTAAESVLPISEVRFQTAQASFVRRVTVETSSRWARVAAGRRRRDFPRAKWRVRRMSAWRLISREQAGRRWRVTVKNGNDAAIADLTPALYITPRRVVFRQEPTRSYRLLYGHAEAAAPQYDFVRLVDDTAIEAAVGATAGTEQLNAGFVDSAPWTERHPWLLWTALAVAVLVLGALAIRTMRSAAG